MQLLFFECLYEKVSIYSNTVVAEDNYNSIYETIGKEIYNFLSKINIQDYSQGISIIATTQNLERQEYFLNVTGPKEDDFYIKGLQYVSDRNYTLMSNAAIIEADKLPKKHLSCLIPEENKYSFYTMLPNSSTNQININYGRIGANDYDQYLSDGTQVFQSKDQTYPLQMFWIKYYEKLLKGYVDKTEYFDFEGKSQNTHQYGDEEFATIADEKVKETMDYLIKRQRQYVSSKYTMEEIQHISDKAIERTKELLKLMHSTVFDKRLKDDTKHERFNNYYAELLITLPRKVENVKAYLAAIEWCNKDDPDYIEKKLEQEQDLLNNFIDVYNDEQTSTNKKTILEANNIEIRVADFKDKWHVLDKMNHKESYGNAGYKAKNIYRVVNKATDDKYYKCVKDLGIDKRGRHLYFHGSRTENWWSIIKNGLSLNPNASTTGSMFGHGLYFAPACGKSINYSDVYGSYWAGGRDNLGYLALYEVAMGKPYYPNSSLSGYFDVNSLAHGCHSVYADKHKVGLRNDECVVFREEQCTIRYLIEIDSRRNQDFTFKRSPVIKDAKIIQDDISYNEHSKECVIKFVSKNMPELCDKNRDVAEFYYLPKEKRFSHINGLGHLNDSEKDFLEDVVMSRYAKNEYEFKEKMDEIYQDFINEIDIKM